MDVSTSSWAFGDGTPATADIAVSHSFDQPGTYVVSFRAKDKAGNESVAQKSITVEAPPSDVTTPRAAARRRIRRPRTAPHCRGSRSSRPSERAEGRPARKVKQLRLRTRAEQAGTLTLRLMRGKKVYSRLTVGLAPGETTQRLRLPRGLKSAHTR